MIRDAGGMMARMLTQAPLPWLPAGAAEIAPGVGVGRGGDGGGVVWGPGLATFAWDGGGEAAPPAAAGQLVPPRAAGQREGGPGVWPRPVAGVAEGSSAA